MKKHKIIYLSASLAIFLAPLFCCAYNIPQPPPEDQATLPSFITYLIDLGMGLGLAAVLIMMAYSGFLYAVSSVSSSAWSKAKEVLSGAVSGLLILLLSFLIITTINPQLNIFNRLKPVESPQLPEPDNYFPGVYFYLNNSCSGKNFWPSSTSIPDFSLFSQSAIGSVKCRHDGRNQIYYISVLYSQKNFYGMCQYVDPNKPCNEEIEIPNIGSATVHKYGSPQGSVIIHRNASVNKEGASFDKSGGFLEIKQSDIDGEDGIYEIELSKLKFIGDAPKSEMNNIKKCTVPENEQDCKEWNGDGTCKARECPNLTGSNIGSIEIQGNYLVILEYLKNGTNTLVADFCEAYPSVDDINKYGPKQIKWDQIRNDPKAFPNYILIIPVIEK